MNQTPYTVTDHRDVVAVAEASDKRHPQGRAGASIASGGGWENVVSGRGSQLNERFGTALRG